MTLLRDFLTELAKFVDLPEEDVKELMCSARQPMSLQMGVGDGDDTILLDLLAGNEDLPSDQIESDCMKGDLATLLQQMPELQARVLRMRYGLDGDDPMRINFFLSFSLIVFIVNSFRTYTSDCWLAGLSDLKT